MSLKAFHIVFVVVSTLLAFGFAAWSFGQYRETRGMVGQSWIRPRDEKKAEPALSLTNCSGVWEISSPKLVSIPMPPFLGGAGGK